MNTYVIVKEEYKKLNYIVGHGMIQAESHKIEPITDDENMISLYINNKLISIIKCKEVNEKIDQYKHKTYNIYLNED